MQELFRSIYRLENRNSYQSDVFGIAGQCTNCENWTSLIIYKCVKIAIIVRLQFCLCGPNSLAIIEDHGYISIKHCLNSDFPYRRL